MASAEYHVASYVVTTRPEHADAVTEEINSLPDLEVHAGKNGKLVVTAEATSQVQLADIAGMLQQLEAVLIVSPVYHEFMPAQTLDTEPGSKAK
jgi:nitrate reductase NapAB chaperone NapD